MNINYYMFVFLHPPVLTANVARVNAVVKYLLP